MDLNTLLEKLNSFWNSTEATEEEDGRWWFDCYEEKAREIVDLLWDHLFIGSQWNPDTRSFLQQNGYRCWIGDGDSFGILVACITKDGKNLSIG